MSNLIKIFCSDGLSASSTDGDNLSDVVGRYLRDEDLSCTLDIISQHSDFDEDFDKQILHLSACGDHRVLLCGKSAGAYKILRRIAHNFSDFARFTRFAALTVDPHYPLQADKDKPLNLLRCSPLMSLINLRQIEHYPTGAEVYGAEDIVVQEVDHFDIVKHPIVIEKLKKSIRYLK